MNTSVDRLALLLAASGLSDKAIYEALQASKSIDTTDLVHRIQFLRQFLFSRLAAGEDASRGSPATNQRRQTADRIIKLLQTEARLSGTRAAHLLAQSLMSDMPLTDLPKFRSKIGLRTWLMQLPVQSSELLHHATKIRNDVIHAHTAPAWPLRERES